MGATSNISRFDGAQSPTCSAAIATTFENATLKSSSRKRLAIIIPCRNEDEVLPETIRRISALVDRLVAVGKLSRESKVVFVDDGSTDQTWELIRDATEKSSYIGGLKLTRNYGHQNALLAGLFTVEGDALISIDADLQDDESAIEAMVDKHVAGAEIVYGVRQRRNADSAFKRLTAELFYRLLRLLGNETVHNHADYRLMSRRAVECLKQFSEVNLFLRGIVPLLGFQSDTVYYDRTRRLSGSSKYSLANMVGLALDGITSFSTAPLRFVTFLGFIVFLVSIIVTAWALWARLFTNYAVPGWTSTVLPMYVIGGLQILCLGVIGEYLGKVYAETKSRPRFFIEKAIGSISTSSRAVSHPNSRPLAATSDHNARW
jgi:glycosyltransferase involved in cell wall biosynthesis